MSCNQSAVTVIDNPMEPTYPFNSFPCVVHAILGHTQPEVYSDDVAVGVVGIGPVQASCLVSRYQGTVRSVFKCGHIFELLAADGQGLIKDLAGTVGTGVDLVNDETLSTVQVQTRHISAVPVKITGKKCDLEVIIVTYL